jgi:prolyl oligopeptidase
MRRMALWTLGLLCAGVASCWSPAFVGYPPTRRAAVVDTYFGVQVTDPYRWLEDPHSPETRAWVQAQNRVTFGYLERIPGRLRLRERLTALWNFPRMSLPFREAGKLFFTRNTGLQKQSVLFVQDSAGSPARVLLDPNQLSPDGSVRVSAYSVSPTGKHLAYACSQGGADWLEFRVREIETGKDLEDRVRWAKFTSASWTKDGRGFFYARYPKPPKGQELWSKTLHHQLYFHTLGTSQADDALIFELQGKPDWVVSARVSEDGRFLFLEASKGTDPKTQLYYAYLGDPHSPDITSPIRPLIAQHDAAYSALGNVGDTFYVLTDLEAPKRRVIAVDRSRPERSAWKSVIPESRRALDSAALVGGKIVAHYLEDAKSKVSLFERDGRPLGDLSLPGIGTVGGLSGRDDTPELFYSFTSYLVPTSIFRRDLATGKDEQVFAPRTAFDGNAYETRQVFYTSKDGTRVPMFVTGKRDLVRNGSHPTILYGYGGFSVSEQPYFSPSIAAWLELGGVWAVANLRGGGEYGEEWHRAGMLAKKQNVFDDFLAAAQYLIREGYTSPARLAIKGGSNGGLLVGAAMTQRPDLFAVALPVVGVLDMLRYHKFSAGVFWVPEYGTADEEAGFRTLYAYSPLHRLKPGTCYPATLIVTADHDDRVVPAHSFKYAAALQAAQGCKRPALIRIETQASHGYRPTDKKIAEAADLLAFTAANLGLRLP